MSQIDYPTGNTTDHFEWLLKFCAAFQLFGLSVHTERGEEAETPVEEHLSPTSKCDCGGYNEAFIMQHWANYDPIR